VRPLDRRELSNFFKSRGADRDCPVCGYEGDLVRLEADADLYVPVIGNPHGGVPVTAVICPQCAFLRLHSLDAMQGEIVDADEALADPGPTTPT
jgi:hypothetical protein